MSSFEIKKRLIGTEDINFDESGEGARADYTTPDGVIKELHKVNASYIPILKDTRDIIGGGVKDVDGALRTLRESLSHLSPYIMMDKDMTVEFTAEDTTSTMQLKIRSMLKNLGGFTLRFIFPENINQSIVNQLKFENFTNGTLIVEGNSITASDNTDIGSMFLFGNCTCRLEIRNFNFIHHHSPYALKFDYCTNGYVINCTFEGQGSTYALSLLNSNVIMEDCSFTDDNEREDISVSQSVVQALTHTRLWTKKVQFVLDADMSVNIPDDVLAEIEYLLITGNYGCRLYKEDAGDPALSAYLGYEAGDYAFAGSKEAWLHDQIGNTEFTYSQSTDIMTVANLVSNSFVFRSSWVHIGFGHKSTIQNPVDNYFAMGELSALEVSAWRVVFWARY